MHITQGVTTIDTIDTHCILVTHGNTTYKNHDLFYYLPSHKQGIYDYTNNRVAPIDTLQLNEEIGD